MSDPYAARVKAAQGFAFPFTGANPSGGGATPGIYTNATVTVGSDGEISDVATGLPPIAGLNVAAPITSTGGATPTIGLNLYEDASIVGTGASAGDPLKINIQSSSGFIGTGSSVSPLGLSINHDASLSGDGGGTNLAVVSAPTLSTIGPSNTFYNSNGTANSFNGLNVDGTTIQGNGISTALSIINPTTSLGTNYSMPVAAGSGDNNTYNSPYNSYYIIFGAVSSGELTPGSVLLIWMAGTQSWHVGSNVVINCAFTLPVKLNLGDAIVFGTLSDGNDHWNFPLGTQGGAAGSNTIFIKNTSGGYTSGYNMGWQLALICM